MMHLIAGKTLLLIDRDFAFARPVHGEKVDIIICSVEDWYANDREMEKTWMPCLSKRGQLILLGGPEGYSADTIPVEMR